MSGTDFPELQEAAYKEVYRYFKYFPLDWEKYEFLTKLQQNLNVSKEWAKDICKEVDAELAGETQRPGEMAGRPRNSLDSASTVPAETEAGGGSAKRQRLSGPGGARRRSRNDAIGAELGLHAPSANNPEGFVKQRVSRYWPEDGHWYEGRVVAWNPDDRTHRIVYPGTDQTSDSHEDFAILANLGNDQLIRFLDLPQEPLGIPSRPSKQPGAKRGAPGGGRRAHGSGRGSRIRGGGSNLHQGGRSTHGADAGSAQRHSPFTMISEDDDSGGE